MLKWSPFPRKVTMSRRLPRLILLAGVAALALGGCASSAEPPADAVRILVKDMAYTPSTVTISAGQTVIWEFDDPGVPHNAVALDGSFQSKLLMEGTFEHTFNSPGTVDFRCTPHPEMVGTIIVTE